MIQKALVVGGTGYVGLELCRRLKERGIDVTILNRSGKCLDPRFEVVQVDMTNREQFNARLTGRHFDLIFHVASLPGDTGDPDEMIRANVVGLTHVLNYARQINVKRLVLSSSISAYGWYPATKFAPAEYLPVDEKHPCRVQDMYSCTKRMQELLALTFYHQYRIPVVVLRLTAVIGPGGRGGGRSWGEFAKQLHEGQCVDIPHFSLDEVCHYVDLRDVARMQIAVTEQADAVGQIFNCCGAHPTSGHEFAEVLHRHFPGVGVKTGFPWSMAQGDRIVFDMSKAKRLLRFEPLYSFEDSIVSIKMWIEKGDFIKHIGADYQTYTGGVAAEITT